MQKKFRDEKCDVKLHIQNRNGSNGHWETVIEATGASAVTNSWGAPAEVRGGTKGGFDHRDNATDTDYKNPDGTGSGPPTRRM